MKIMPSLKNLPQAKGFHFALLLFLVVVFGFNWPITKIALVEMPPLWLAVSRFVVSVVLVFMYLLMTKQLRFPGRKDLGILLTISLLQMAAFITCVQVGLMYVDAGRSSILVYTTPFWITPIAVLFFKESVSWLKITGLILGLLGVLLLFNPLNFNWHNSNMVIGNLYLLIAAFAWAAGIMHSRYAKWNLTPIQLLPWQLLIATVILFVMAEIFEPHAKITWNADLFGSLFFIGVLATAAGYWIMLEVSRNLPSTTTSLCLLGVPVIGVLSSHFILNEKITMTVLFSMMFIVIGLGCVVKASMSQSKLKI